MSRRIEIEGASIAYEEHGTGFPILAIHGFYPDRRLLTGALEPLFDEADRAVIPPSAGCGRPGGARTRRTYRRIYPDLPFMGESGNPETVRTSDDMLRIVDRFARALIPEGPFLVAGESYGGYLARGLSRAFGERIEGFLLICPMIVANASSRDLPGSSVFRTEPGYAEGAPPEAVQGFESFTVIRDSYTWARACAEVSSGVDCARADSLERLRAEGYAFSFDRLGAIEDDAEPFDPLFEGPALFLLGRQDASVGWRDALRLTERYPRGTYAILDLAGHNLQIEQAGLFGALAGEWLGRCEDTGNVEGQSS